MTTEEYHHLCDFRLHRSVDRLAVERALERFYVGLAQPIPEVVCYQSLRKARDASSAWAPTATAASRSAWTASVAWTASAASTRYDWSASTASAASAARFSSDRWSAMVILPDFSRSAWTASIAWDASYCSLGALRADPEIAKTWAPIVEAFDAGCWLFFLGDRQCSWVPVPRMIVESTRTGWQCHCDTGPALIWPDETEEPLYFLHGVSVLAELVTTPANQLDVRRWVVGEPNAEIRREAVRKIGIERVCEALHAQVIDRGLDHAGQPCELLMLHLGDGRRRPYLKMRNPSIGVYHIEGRPADITTVDQALRYQQPEAMQALPISESGADWYQQGDVFVWPKSAVSLKPKPVIMT